MKEKYLRPVVVNAEILEDKGVAPLALAGVTIKGIAFLLGGFLAGKAVAKAMARPAFKLPSLTKGGNIDDDFCMA